MRSIVCIKQVPDTTEIKIDPKTNTLMRAGVPSIVNPFDLYALEMALRCKEQFGGEVIVLSMGPAQAEKALKRCLAMGADKAYLVSDRMFGGSDTLATSYILSMAIKKIGGFDMIFCGRQAIDGDTGQVGPEIAEHLGIPQVTCAIDMAIEEGKIIATREQEMVLETIRLSMPAVLTVEKGVNSPRYPSLLGIIRACSDHAEMISCKDLEEIDASRIGLKGSPTKVVKTYSKSRKTGGLAIDTGDTRRAAQELIERLGLKRTVGKDDRNG